ncbi:MAG: hypothetical protein GX558_08560 [Clostridiales bacterium]|nr:hypothetical protein [Clostridiales bacterium]
MALKYVNRPTDGTVRISDDFFGPRLDTLYHVTLPDTFDKLEADGALENYEHLISGTGGHRGCPWHDGLLLETIRAAGDYLSMWPDSALEARIDHYADVIERAQRAGGGGYLSTYTMLARPNQRYGENGGSILLQHDLYNNGALLEAGVHYYAATGKDKLLGCALRCANELCDTLGRPPKKWVVPGHSLIEYALIELYELTRRDPGAARAAGVDARPDDYLALADFFIHGRGHHAHRINHPQYMGEYAQDHAPIENQVQAVGHAVRAALYYTGAARLAITQGDDELLGHAMRLWRNARGRKMHINGGIGATHFEEKFGEDYDLTNSAYLETCATVALVFWAEAMSRATGDAEFFAEAERGVYNLLLSSVSLEGTKYFYRNPLLSKGDDHRWAWHGCPCCPPMLHKAFSQLNRMIYAQSEGGLYVNLLIGSTLEAEGVRVEMESSLPWTLDVRLRVAQAASPLDLFVRVPAWGKRLRWTVDGRAVEPEIEKGYARFRGVVAGCEIALVGDLHTVRMRAHPYVRADRGRVALMRGPLVYCVEGTDNEGNVDIELPEDFRVEEEWAPDLLGGVMALRGLTANGERFVAVPLYAWDNREPGPMAVWLRQRGMDDGWGTQGWENSLYREYQPS